MRAAADAYRSVAKEIASPRDLEADLLLKAAAQLQTISDSWDRDNSGLDRSPHVQPQALDNFSRNRSQVPDSELPTEIRENVASLGVFIVNHTFAVMANPRREALASLININRELGRRPYAQKSSEIGR